MDIPTVIAVIALVVIVFLAVRYIYKEKKKGTVCIGCPLAGQCVKYGNPDHGPVDFDKVDLVGSGLAELRDLDLKKGARDSKAES